MKRYRLIVGVVLCLAFLLALPTVGSAQEPGQSPGQPESQRHADAGNGRRDHHRLQPAGRQGKKDLGRPGSLRPGSRKQVLREQALSLAGRREREHHHRIQQGRSRRRESPCRPENTAST